MAPGYRPDWVGKQRYKGFYLYGVIEPLTGVLIDIAGPEVGVKRFFVEALRQEVEGEVALVWDRVAGHRSVGQGIPEGMRTALP